MAQLSARRAALEALRMWREQNRLADSIIGHLLSETKLKASDRAFALELFYGVLRNLTLLDFWIGQLRQGKVDVDLRDILRLGLYQILLANISEHAAVYESVELAAKKNRGFINALLRSSLRQRAQLLSDAEAAPLTVRMSHPEFLIARWQKQFGTEEAAALCKWNNQPPAVYARINELKITRTDFLQFYPDARPLSEMGQFVEFSHKFPNDALSRGHCYIQDPSTRLACEVLAPEAGEKILDACSAPGGKTSYLAQQMQNKGLIMASDRQLDRINILAENMDRLGAKIARPVRHDWSRDIISSTIASAAPFDRILVDAPCTNTGVMRRRADVRWRLRPSEFRRMQELQMSILRAVVPLLKPDGVLVYSTCSLEPEENEVVSQLLGQEMPILRLDAEQGSLPFRDGFDGAYVARFIKAA